ncbi:TetR/AcrR family transcriptional regulator [Mycobacterium spongiae]|uniref:TetR family transcriptional regulator n=1 Tax=Mycobacterium spongiae TaxID=886343 RepID=A0A975PZ76_9MYCO|nr:TetR/AcrR family transcriptional regulator [Mycobacterium spongiae]QUR69867.1 TetR family transcriptional regulator [Mycobacterium spongiae]
MATMPQGRTPQDQPSVRDDLLHAAISLLDDHGPDALQARKVAAEAGTSTMAVYTHFAGMRELITEVVAEGFRQFDAALTVPQTADPVADFLSAGVAYRRYAIERPHMYRLMFGSAPAQGISAPVPDVLALTLSEIYQSFPAFGHVVRGMHRSMLVGRISLGPKPDDAAVESAAVAAAAQFWALMHGFVMLELAGFFGSEGSAFAPVLASMTTNLLIAMGDQPQQVVQSLLSALGTS